MDERLVRMERSPGYASGGMPAVEIQAEPVSPDFVKVSQNASRFLYDNDPNERNPAHTVRTLELLKKYFKETDEVVNISPELMMGVMVHDIIDHGIVNPKNPELEQKTREFIKHTADSIDNKQSFEYAAEVAISTSKWEDRVAEAWRQGALNTIMSEQESYVLDPSVAGVDEATQRNVLSAAILNEKTDVDQETQLKVLRQAEIFDLDVGRIKDAMVELEVEGLLIKACELVDNLDHPPADNVASTWRDCIEIFNCYAPALELFGFDRMAKDLRGKALEFFYDDPEGRAQAQREMSEQAYHPINEKIAASVETVGGENYHIFARVKSAGSIRKKLSSERYAGKAEMLPDGVGVRILVPDELSSEEIISFAKNFKSDMETAYDDIRSGHPHPDEDTFDDSVTSPRPGGYSAVHMTFFYQDTPFEVQIVREADDKKHKYDQASHIFYSLTKSQPDEEELRALHIIQRRAEHLRMQPLNSELRPNSWRYGVEYLLDELDSTVGRFYTPVRINDESFMVPKELEHMYKSASNGDSSGDIGTTYMPLDFIDEESFYEILNLIDPKLGQDEDIKIAIEDVKAAQGDKSRRDGKDIIQGHLLPTALHSATMAVSNGEHWDTEDPIGYLKTLITAAILHDFIEDTDHDSKYVEARYGHDVADIVSALTSPSEIEDEFSRREVYADQILKNRQSQLIKLPDRMQNCVTDLLKWNSLGVSASSEENEELRERITNYFAKTDRHLTHKIFDHLPPKYRKVQKVIWEMADHFGFV